MVKVTCNIDTDLVVRALAQAAPGETRTACFTRILSLGTHVQRAEAEGARVLLERGGHLSLLTR